ncbi:hypothetical protein BGW80DRAFT_148045 [Lactifluus volemus]|nr:hypothetical protein BGW80DRAFT_148045 [Lactifluus volemus]
MAPKNKLSDYIAHLDAAKMTGHWKPVGKWQKVHGDTKSTTRGKWTMFTMTSSETPHKYKVKIMENGKHIVAEHDFATEPSFETIVEHFHTHHG